MDFFVNCWDMEWLGLFMQSVIYFQQAYACMKMICIGLKICEIKFSLGVTYYFRTSLFKKNSFSWEHN